MKKVITKSSFTCLLGALFLLSNHISVFAAENHDSPPSAIKLDNIFTVPSGSNSILIQNDKFDIVQLTDSVKNQSGAVWSTDENKMDLTKDFEAAMYIYFGDSGEDAADGMAFVMHNDKNGNNAFRTGEGARKGVWDSTKPKEFGLAIMNSFAVEFDTYFNKDFDRGVPKQNHIAWNYPGKKDTYDDSGLIFKDRRMIHNDLQFPGLLSNDTWRYFTVRWDSKQSILTYQLQGLKSVSVPINVNDVLLQRVLLSSIQRNLHNINTLEQLRSYIPLEDIVITKDTEEIESKLNQGFVIIQLKKTDELCALINVENASLGIRENNETENEFSVVGPKIGFVENIDVNIHLLRKQIVTSNLIFEEITIGTMSKTKVVFFYLNDVTNPRHVKTVRERLEKIDFDVIFDSSQIDQIITDNSNTPFPLFLSTERIDRVIYALINGQVAIMSNGSPYAITGPATIMDFFMSPEDYYLPWIIGSFFRIIRIFGVVFSIFSTPIYVAILTYHYEIIPMDLLGPIVSSRANVPFPPVLEVIFLEITIELLREAGARLPTKIGQTLGIVGGIVIGQASVEAALTSAILLIIVSLSALASFTTPIFKMSNTIRLLRFPFILAASLWGDLELFLASLSY